MFGLSRLAWIKWGFILAIATAAGLLFWQNRALIEEKAQQAMTIVQQRGELADQQQRIDDLDRQRVAAEEVATREKARAIRIREEARGLRDEIQRLERDNADVRAYLDTRMPAELYDLLRVVEDADGGTD